MKRFEIQGELLNVWIERPAEYSKAIFAASHPGQLFDIGERVDWLDQNRLDQIWKEKKAQGTLTDEQILLLEERSGAGQVRCINENWGGGKLPEATFGAAGKKRVNLLALGDVGSTLLIGLKLLGGDIVSEIGICDMNINQCRRWESEMNQIAFAWDYDRFPPVKIVRREQLFDCDAFLFCASKGVPPVDSKSGKTNEGLDVRMAQYEANRGIVREYAKQARLAGFQGLFAVVSDPVDPLCKAAFYGSNEGADGQFDGLGLRPEQIQGYGLGVMNARAAYFAKADSRFTSFLSEGRAFGPHGQDLVIADSIENYDEELSLELTKLTIEANLRTREWGFKPYVAPALSSAAISVIQTLSGQWHYSSNFLGGVYMGAKNRMTSAGVEVEQLPLPSPLWSRLERAYRGLEMIQA